MTLKTMMEGFRETRRSQKFKWTLVVILLVFITECSSIVSGQDETCVWTKPILSTLIISLVPFLILPLIPLDTTTSSENDDSDEKEATAGGVGGHHDDRLKLFLSFAAGGLLGDAFLHLIPHADQAHRLVQSVEEEDIIPVESHGGIGGHHDHFVGGWVLVGFLVFLVTEKGARILHGFYANRRAHEQNSDGQKKSGKSAKNVATKIAGEPKEFQIAGYLNLLADLTHNITDGLAIGVSYASSPALGMTTTIAVLLHEIPHEIGDFVLLIRSGCSKKNAILLQLATAVGAVAGTIFSVMVGGRQAGSWMLAATAGGFIYIATVSIIPEILQGGSGSSSGRAGRIQAIKEILALLAGIGLMLLLAVYAADLEEYLMHLFNNKEKDDSIGGTILHMFRQWKGFQGTSWSFMDYDYWIS